MEHVTCCVVGGGPAGVMLSVLLARAGVKVAVLEKHRDFLRDFRGDTVHPSTLRLLDELGLGRKFAELPGPELTEMRMRVAGETVVAANFGRLPGRHKHIRMVPQWDFLDLLAAAEPLDLRMGTEVTGLRRTDGRVTGVTYRDSDGEGELSADLVVACDGRDSVVRQAAGLQPDEFPLPMDVWQVRIPAPPNDERDGRVFGVFGNGQVAVTMDRGDYHQTSYLIPKGEDARLRARGLDWFRGRLAELFGWDSEVLAEIRSWDDVKLLETSMGRLPQWHVDGLLCLGDAAHTMSPVGGVGVNLAVQDAVAAARILAGPLSEGRVSTQDLAKVQKRREWPTRVAQRAQLGEHEMLLKPALEGTLTRVPPPLRAVQRFPLLAVVSAYLGGIGVRPEHAPAFARR
ncbi:MULTISPECIES: FAD-dependent oxidoreductase [unclassified Amycolatopsis]|uniref:FAD-dependent oxidoreductase n=1 Tax=unclassified Amycolatopsis TaxID=2618356 RepID=UPI0004885FE3|nr:FAD-dependent oxidoreductase [Amycolatopsis sp. ATCC 39116]